MINGKKHTPSSGTLKKMKRKAAMEAAAKKATAEKPKAKKAKTKAKTEAPVPRPRSERPTKMTKLKRLQRKAAIPGDIARADAKVKADAERGRVLKGSKLIAAEIAYAKGSRGI
jgi:hypothetical protein